MSREIPVLVDPAEFLTKPLELWTVRDLTDALGYQLSATVVGTSKAGIAQMRHRRSATNERLQRLRDAVAANEDGYRKALVTIYSTGAFRRQS